MERLTKEDVSHVATLAHLAINENELDKYETQLNDILTEVEKIIDANIKEDSIMISPSSNSNRYNDDTVEDMLKVEDVLKNASKTNGNFVSVARVIND